MILSFTILLICQCVGELISHALRLPVPGPVIGAVLLLGALLRRPELEKAVAPAANGLVQHLSLLFIPAGAGIITAAKLIHTGVPAIAAALLVSGVLTIVVTALTVSVLGKWQSGITGVMGETR